MPVKILTASARMTAYLSGEIDHHNAAPLRDAIDASARRQRPPILRLDFSDVSFMDSSGVGLVMGRCRLVNGYGGRVEIAGLSGRYLKMMQLSGMERIAKIVKEEPHETRK